MSQWFLFWANFEGANEINIFSLFNPFRVVVMMMMFLPCISVRQLADYYYSIPSGLRKITTPTGLNNNSPGLLSGVRGVPFRPQPQRG